MSLLPGSFNLPPMIRGAVWEPKPFYLTVAGTAKDLTDCTVTLGIYDENGDLVKTLADGSGLTIDAVAGTISPRQEIADVLAIPAGKYTYMLWIVEADAADKNRWLEGYLEVIV